MNEESNIIEILKDAAHNIMEANMKKSEASVNLRHAKHQERVARAKATIGHQDAKNQKILEAIVDSNEEVIAQEKSTLLMKARLEVADIKVCFEDNKFIAARKIGGMDEKELCAISGSVIKNTPRIDE